MKKMGKHLFDLTGNAVIGFVGTTFTLNSANEAMGLLGGALTVTYMVIKIYFIIKKKDKKP